MYTFGSLSCFSLLIIIIVYLYENSKNKSTPAFELIFYLCIASLINTIASMLLYIPHFSTEYIDPTLCKLQGSLIFFSELSRYLITTNISIFIFRIKTKDQLSDKFTPLKRLLYLCSSFGISAIITAICFYLDLFGVNKDKCWIKKELDGQPEFIECLVIWILIFINLALGLITYMKKFRCYITQEILYRIEFSNRLMMFPIVSFICWLVYSLTIYFDFMNKDLIILDYISVIFNLLEGFLFAGVSMYNLSFRRKLKKICWKLYFFRKKNKDVNINEILFYDNNKSEKSKISCNSCVIRHSNIQSDERERISSKQSFLLENETDNKSHHIVLQNSK